MCVMKTFVHHINVCIENKPIFQKLNEMVKFKIIEAHCSDEISPGIVFYLK